MNAARGGSSRTPREACRLERGTSPRCRGPYNEPPLEIKVPHYLQPRWLDRSARVAENPPMSYQQITYEVRGEVAWITLNRPEKLNAWTPHMATEQADAIERANADRSVGAIVMTGAGRGFCAGADMQATFQTRIDGKDPG